MAVRIAIVGPGRVGMAFARRFVHADADLLGVVGRDRARTEAAIDELGLPAGDIPVLDWGEALTAHVLIFAVGDGDLEAAIAEAVAVGGRPCSLWLHTSGRHGLDVFDQAERPGVRIGALHPLLPFSASVATHSMRGSPALLLGEDRSKRLLQRLCALLELDAIVCGGHNRALYHAACALAANGSTALFGLASDLIRSAGGVTEADGNRIVASLMQAAVASSSLHGAGPALSGPVRRGDDATVKAHLAALDEVAKPAIPAYAALMTHALQLARDEGLAAADCERIARALSLLSPSS